MRKAAFLKEKITDSEIQNVVRELVVESEQKYKILVENSLIGILIHCDGTIIYANPCLRNMVGYQENERKDRTVWGLIHPEMREQIRDRFYRRIKGENVESQYEAKIIKKDGSPVDVLVKAVPLNSGGKNATLVYIVDISELKQAQREIQELSTIVETALIPIVKLDSTGGIIYINRSAEALFKSELAQLKDKPFSNLLSGIEPEEIQNHIIRQTLKGGFDAEIFCKHPDGPPIKMRLTTCPLINEKSELTAIVGFLVNPNVREAENNLLNQGARPISIESISESYKPRLG